MGFGAAACAQPVPRRTARSTARPCYDPYIFVHTTCCLQCRGQAGQGPAPVPLRGRLACGCGAARRLRALLGAFGRAQQGPWRCQHARPAGHVLHCSTPLNRHAGAAAEGPSEKDPAAKIARFAPHASLSFSGLNSPAAAGISLWASRGATTRRRGASGAPYRPRPLAAGDGSSGKPKEARAAPAPAEMERRVLVRALAAAAAQAGCCPGRGRPCRCPAGVLRPINCDWRLCTKYLCCFSWPSLIKAELQHSISEIVVTCCAGRMRSET